MAATGLWGPTVGLAQGASQAPPPFQIQRHAEDYSYLCDRPEDAEALGPWERLKLIPFDETCAVRLTVGGQVRWTYEFFDNADWGEGDQDSGGYGLWRTMLHGDFWASERVRIFVGLMANHELGREGGPRPPDENRFDVHKAFLEWHSTGGVRFRLGRQEFNYGSGRLISVREGPNSRNAFDGLRFDIPVGEWEVDIFAARPVETDPGTLDDGAIDSRALWGVHGTRPLDGGRSLQIYYLGWENTRARFEQGPGEELRHSLGARWARSKGHGWDYNFEAVYQFGDYDSTLASDPSGGVRRGDISAFTVASDSGFTFGRHRLKPRLGLKVNVTSGDRDPNDPDLDTFNPLVPKGNYFGGIGLLGPYNLWDIHPSIGFRLGPKLGLLVDLVAFWRQSDDDAVYGTPGNLARGDRGSDARHIGIQPGIEVEWAVSRFFEASLVLSHFRPGRFIEETGPSEAVTYVEFKGGFRF